MYSHSSTVVGDIVTFNLKWGINGVRTDFVPSLMLNFWSTFFKYPFCVKLTLPLLRSFSIYMPSTFFASPRSFISNLKDKSFFNLSIADLLLEALRWVYRPHVTVDKHTLYPIAYCSKHMGHNGFVYTSCLLWSCQNICTTVLMIVLVYKVISSTCIPYVPFLQFWTSPAEICRSPLQDRHREWWSSHRADQVLTRTVLPMPINFE